MSKDDFIRKLTSRKFWLAVAAFVTELIIAFKGDAELAETLSGMIMAGATVIAYSVGEGRVDSETKGSGGGWRKHRGRGIRQLPELLLP